MPPISAACSVRTLAAALARLLSDPELAARLGAAARETVVHRFDIAHPPEKAHRRAHCAGLALETTGQLTATRHHEHRPRVEGRQGRGQLDEAVGPLHAGEASDQRDHRGRGR